MSGVSEQFLSRASNDVLQRAFDEAQRLKDEYVSTEHILLGIAGADRDPAAQLLASRRKILRPPTAPSSNTLAI